MSLPRGLAIPMLAMLTAIGCRTAELRPPVEGDARIFGQLIVWHPLTLTFDGPAASEMDSDPNPFLDYRLSVTFVSPRGARCVAAGFFDGDGVGGPSGTAWRVRFTPSEAGFWRYTASFRAGPGVAIDLDPAAGAPAAFDGASGSFRVAPRSESAPGFLRWGRLEYVGGHYLKFRDGPFYLKGGTDSPENLLSYTGFVRTQPGPFGIHSFVAHERDWRPGDPDWADGAGRGIIGALNYLAGQHVNSIYFLPCNIGGDGRDVWPFAGPIDPAGSPANDNLHYDVGKLAQWEIVFAHAQRMGLMLHFVLNEMEDPNQLELDGGALGPERKLYYRELVARFAHHNALVWNISEEYESEGNGILPADAVVEFAAYLQAVDPYDHPITVHQWHNPDEAWAPFVGDPRFSCTSFQWTWFVAEAYEGFGPLVESWRGITALSGRPLPIFIDEIDDRLTPENADRLRTTFLWPAYLSGCAGVEYIFAELLAADDFRPYEDMWRYTWYARKFVEGLPFWEMEPADDLLIRVDPDAQDVLADVSRGHRGASPPGGIEGGEVLAKAGVVYAVYLPDAGMPALLSVADVSGGYMVRWYNPREGGYEGEARAVAGGLVHLGAPPSDPTSDWAVLLRRAR